jgi:hypothetical protein
MIQAPCVKVMYILINYERKKFYDKGPVKKLYVILINYEHKKFYDTGP